ncbi:hypothetical protein AVEN_246461-1 [Araneus ventricosus]|uniref:Uncharacterized protein n=1 Tax=Araneus ventricosus TaxID=182803 RepID=A0A4Y2EM16_ARAVE|nr:hypothetical protein AVEN_246461-1 [Araneus ventricosus]
MDLPLSTVHKIVRKVMLYPYKIKLVQQLEPNNPSVRESFALEFLGRMGVDEHWPWNILRTYEAHFYVNGEVNTHKCRNLAKQIHHVIHPLPLHSPKIIVWCGMTASVIIGPLSLDNIFVPTVKSSELSPMNKAFSKHS